MAPFAKLASRERFVRSQIAQVLLSSQVNPKKPNDCDVSANFVAATKIAVNYLCDFNTDFKTETFAVFTCKYRYYGIQIISLFFRNRHRDA